MGVGCPVTCSGFLPQGNEVTLLPSAEASQNEGRHHVAFSVSPLWGGPEDGLGKQGKTDKTPYAVQACMAKFSREHLGQNGACFPGHMDNGRDRQRKYFLHNRGASNVGETMEAAATTPAIFIF